MKKVFVILNFRTGEYEHTDKHVIEVPEKEDIHKYAEDVLIRDMFLDGEEEEDGFYFDSGCICVNILSIEEITDKEYKVLNKFL